MLDLPIPLKKKGKNSFWLPLLLSGELNNINKVPVSITEEENSEGEKIKRLIVAGRIIEDIYILENMVVLWIEHCTKKEFANQSRKNNYSWRSYRRQYWR